MKTAIVTDKGHGVFGLEYDNTLGKKHTMRLDAATYEAAVREARSFLGIGDNDCDEDGAHWTVD